MTDLLWLATSCGDVWMDGRARAVDTHPSRRGGRCGISTDSGTAGKPAARSADGSGAGLRPGPGPGARSRPTLRETTCKQPKEKVMSSYPAPSSHRVPTPETSSGAFWIVATLMLGALVGTMAIFSLLMWADVHDKKSGAGTAAAASSDHSDHSMPGMDMGTTAGSASSAGAFTSYAGTAPENADALAEAHKPYPAAMPPVAAGEVANVRLDLTDRTIDIAPGVK